jgi:ABC-type antimicrobial peptide transport system permease subunit
VTKDNLPQYQIVGLVSDAHYRSLRETPPPIFYQPSRVQQATNRFMLEIRTTGPPESLIQPVRQLMRSIDPTLPLYQVAILENEVNRSLWQERLTVGLSSSFAVVAMILSAIGLYGMLAYFVIQHRREIGVRMAIGAKASEIIRMVSKKILASLFCGVLAGAGLFALGAKSLQTILYGVQTFDRGAIAEALVLLMTVAIAATLVPCLRAIQIDPASTLRED